MLFTSTLAAIVHPQLALPVACETGILSECRQIDL